MKFIKCITFLCFKFFLWQIISVLSIDTFNNNIAIFDRKIVYFYLRSYFRGRTTLRVYSDFG